MPDPSLPTQAALRTARAHGIAPDRCEVLQNGSTLVLRLTETLVARVVQDLEGPRQGTGWFARENAVAQHLARAGAPVIPMHPEIPPGPHEHSGYPINFWQYVQRSGRDPEPEAIGRTLYQCHQALRGFAALREFPRQPLHGDAHIGNLMDTTLGLLWTDWEDTFSGPVEWDLASVIWNARVLEENHTTADAILAAYRAAGGGIDGRALHHSMIGRAAVMTAWYPVLYPEMGPERQEKLRRRLEWLEKPMINF